MADPISKEISPPSSVRIRDNQRRSRARRKELIEDLKQRLRIFEREGAQATIEIQIAAQEVATENYILRSLLREHGVTDLEIEDSIRSKLSTPDDLLDEDCQLKVANPLRQLLLPEDTTPCKLSNPSFLHGPPSKLLAQEPAQKTTPRASQAPSHGLSDFRLRVFDVSPVTPLVHDIAPQHLEAQKLGSYDRSADDTTSCEIAASIIASMHGHVDAEEARAELGCSSNVSCMVKNTTIFQSMDR